MGGSDAGLEILADAGSIAIVEDRPIVEVNVVGSGVSLPSYNALEYWLHPPRRAGGEPDGRQRTGPLWGQHPTEYHLRLLSQRSRPEEHSQQLREQAHGMTRAFTIPGRLAGRFYENTARFIVGDEPTVHGGARTIRVRAGGRGFGEAGGPVPRHRANYAIRLIDVLVRVDGVRETPDFPPVVEGSQATSRTARARSHDSPCEEARPQVFQTEHREYSVPWHYPNVAIDGWLEYNDKGTELFAEHGTITIQEECPIVSATTVASGCSSPNYHLLEWWPGDEANEWRRTRRLPPQAPLMMRQQADGLKGQHPTSEMSVFLGRGSDTEKDLADKMHDITHNHHLPFPSIMNGLHENTAHFRIGDTSRPALTTRRIVLRGGALDLEDPYQFNSRFPGDFTCRLIDVEVRKDADPVPFAPLSPAEARESETWSDDERLARFRDLSSRSMIPFPEEWAMRKRTGPRANGIPFLKYGFAHFAPRDNWALGPIRSPVSYEVEHHAYQAPFDYPNASIENQAGESRYGVHLLADAGRITIEEQRPIVAVAVVGSGSAPGGYVILDWSGPGQAVWDFERAEEDRQLIRRVMVEGLDGQYPSPFHEDLMETHRFSTVDEANAFVARMRERAARATDDFADFDALTGGIYENTAHARIGDSSRPELVPRRIRISAGCLGGPTNRNAGDERFPGDYAVRLIDVAVRA